MLTPQEEKFLIYWQENRDKEKKSFRKLLIGLPAGLLIAAGIAAALVTGGWYERADMEANRELNLNVIIIALLCIVVFMAIFYKNYRWDQNEQLYQELKNRKNKTSSQPFSTSSQPFSTGGEGQENT